MKLVMFVFSWMLCNAVAADDLHQFHRPALKQQGAHSVAHSHVMPTAPGQRNSAVYFIFKNGTNLPVQLIGASSLRAKEVEIHEHVEKDGLMSMQKAESVIVPVGDEVTFAPGGYHIMLMNLDKPIKEGDVIDITLILENGQQVDFKAVASSDQSGMYHKH